MDRSTFAQPVPDVLFADLSTGYTAADGGFEDRPFEFVGMGGGARRDEAVLGHRSSHESGRYGTALPDQTGGVNAVVWFITGLEDDLFPVSSARTM